MRLPAPALVPLFGLLLCATASSARDAMYWEQNPPQMAFPPYWFFSSANGVEILQDRIKPARSVGVHVPVSIPADPVLRPAELRGYDLFTMPGESRVIPTGH